MGRFATWYWRVFLCAGLVTVFGRSDEPAPRANLAAYGRVWIADTADPGARTDASALLLANQAAMMVTGGNSLTVEWDEPRAVRGVALTFDPRFGMPDDMRLEWWHRIWPNGGSGGWMKLDDPFNGDWTAGRVASSTNGNVGEFTFLPLEAGELPGTLVSNVTHRLTYRIRCVSAKPYALTHFEAFSDTVLRPARIRFQWNCLATLPGPWNPTFEVRNGTLRGVQREGKEAAVVDVEFADPVSPASADRGFVVFRNGPVRSFSVFVDDVMRDGSLWVRDIGVFVSDPARVKDFKSRSEVPAGGGWIRGTVASQVAELPEQSFEHLSKAIPEKAPNYLFLGAPNLRQEICVLPQGELRLRADSLRSPGQDMAARPWTWDDITYQFGTGEHPRMGATNGHRIARSLEGGWMPIVRHEWSDGDLAWSETVLAAPLEAPIDQLNSETGTETLVGAVRFEVTNASTSAKEAFLWMEINRPSPLRVAMGGMMVLGAASDRMPHPGLVPVRGRWESHGTGTVELAVLEPGGAGSHNPALRNSQAAREAVRYRVEVPPGEKRVVDVFVPYVELMDAREVGLLRALHFDRLREQVGSFWKSRVERGMTLDVPDSYLNDFFKANLWHVLISTDIDPFTHQYQHGAATHSYANFLNETAMVAESLEMRGEHLEALRLLQPFLANQGVKGLPGNFRSRDGVFYAAHPGEPDPYTAQGYNMHHGWGLWLAAEHYLFTRDRDYLARVAPQLKAAADWIIRERQATKFGGSGGTRPLEFGLAPAGDLEDVEEYLYFYATDAYYHLGLKRAGEVLADVGVDSAPAKVMAKAEAKAKAKDKSTAKTNANPQPKGKEKARAAAAKAARLADWRAVARGIQSEAEVFRGDILASVAEATATCPVVRLRDGSWVPWVPHRAYARTHLREGWIREGLYPALHLVAGEVIDPGHPFVDWMIQDLEDNIFPSSESGYGIQDFASRFFDVGGFTLQPNLLDLPMVYLARGQVANALRCFYNTGWASLYPDVLCFAEWVPELGRGAGPLYKTPDESKFVQWLRQLLVRENGESLELGFGVPKAWMQDGKRIRMERAATHFGSVDLEIVSAVGSGRVEATVAFRPSTTGVPIHLRIRHPDGKPLKEVRVNGRGCRIDAARQSVALPMPGKAWKIEATF